jgi:hypothetical protein
MEGGGTKRSPAMLCVVEADRHRTSDRADADEVCPLVAKVVAHKHISICRDAVDDGPKYRRITKSFLAVGESSFFTSRFGEQRRWLQMAKKICAATEKRLVPIQRAVNIGEREIAEEDREKVFAIKIASERSAVGVGSNRKRTVFYKNAAQ